jgi:uncharacterized protein (TIGR02466 family)
MMNSENIALFPIPVVRYNIGREYSAKELNFIKNLETRSNQNNKTSSDSYVLEKEELNSLKEFCQSAVYDFLKNIYSAQDSAGIRITQSWINYTNVEESHHKHHHPNSIVSGVLYIDTVKDDNITFYKPGLETYKFIRKEFNIFNSSAWWIPAETGSLLLFPSELEHAVEKKKHQGRRISLSFNTFFTGTIGDELELIELKL